MLLLAAAAALWLLRDEGPVDEAAPAPRSAPVTTVSSRGPAPVRDVPATDDDEALALVREGPRSSGRGLDAGADGAAEGDAGLVDALARAQVARMLEDNAALAAKSVDAYCAATRGLVEEQDKRTRQRDAALFMAGRTDWEGGRLGLLHLAASLTQRMSTPPGAWRRMGPEAYAGLDFTWMKQLLQFDHWSVMTAGPLRDGQTMNYMEAPIPNFVTLQNWAKLRLLKGLHEGDLPAASVEVRHLAELCGTTGSLVGDMIRVAILGIERGFYEEHRLPHTPALTAAEATRVRSAAFAAIGYLMPGVDSATRAKALKCLPNRCTALVEAMGMTTSLRAVAPEAERHLAWLESQPPCDPALSQFVARAPPAPIDEVLGSNVTVNFEDNLRLLLDGGVP